jgi:hypothetical protein
MAGARSLWRGSQAGQLWRTTRKPWSENYRVQALAFRRRSNAILLRCRATKRQQLAAALGTLQNVGPLLHHLGARLYGRRLMRSIASAASGSLGNSLIGPLRTFADPDWTFLFC